jgi:GNAT superfamily N-acetyltransferase
VSNDGRSETWRAALRVLAPLGISDEQQLRDVLQRARRHRVEHGIVDHLVGTGTAPAWLTTHRDELLTIARLERLRALHAIDAMRRTLPVDFIAVKGPVAALRWYDDPNHRTFGDVDVLIRRSNFVEALEALDAAGAMPLSVNWHGFARHHVAEIPLEFHSTTVDLHWDLVALGRDRKLLEFDVDALFERSIEVQLSGVDIRTLDDVDTLLHHCVNTGLDGARRLGSLIDIEHIVSRGDIDAEVLSTRARSIGAGALCAAVLQRTRIVLDSDVPDDLIRPLQPWRGWLFSNAWIDRQGRRGTPRESVAPGIWLSAGRARRRATVAAFGSRVGARFAELAGRPSIVEPGGVLDWQRTPGDPGLARRTYVRWVDGSGDVKVVQRVAADDLWAHLEAREPRATPLLGASRSALRTRWSGRAELVVRGDEVIGALLTERWLGLHRVGYPILLDVAAAPVLAELIDRLGVTNLAGFDEDVLPLEPLLDRWSGAADYTAATLPPGFRWGPPPPTTRVATPDDIDDLTTIMWHHAAHGFPSRRQLRRRLRRAIDELVVVTVADDRIVGFAARDSSTHRYHHWAHIVVEPEHRRTGRSWDLVAAAAAAASEAGTGLIGFGAASNPMPVPTDALMRSTWHAISLSPPDRWPGEKLARTALEQLISWQLGKSRADLGQYRRPGRNDDLVTDRRTQISWERDDEHCQRG